MLMNVPHLEDAAADENNRRKRLSGCCQPLLQGAAVPFKS